MDATLPTGRLGVAVFRANTSETGALAVRKGNAQREEEGCRGRSLVRSRGLTEPAAVELRVRGSVTGITGEGEGREHVAELLVGPHPVAAVTSGISRCVGQKTLRRQRFGRRATARRVAIRGDFLGTAFSRGDVVGPRHAERGSGRHRAAFPLSTLSGESSSARNYRIPATANDPIGGIIGGSIVDETAAWRIPLSSGIASVQVGA